MYCPNDDLALAQRNGRLQRNFQGYSVQMASDLVGLGVSAISQVGDCYLQNARQLDDYYQLLASKQFPVTRGCGLSAEDKLRRYIIMELICNLQLDIAACNQRFDIDFRREFAAQLPRLQEMQSDGLLELDEHQLRITEAGRTFLRVICMCFDAYLVDAPNASPNLLHPQPNKEAARRFSATL